MATAPPIGRRERRESAVASDGRGIRDVRRVEVQAASLFIVTSSRRESPLVRSRKIGIRSQRESITRVSRADQYSSEAKHTFCLIKLLPWLRTVLYKPAANRGECRVRKYLFE